MRVPSLSGSPVARWQQRVGVVLVVGLSLVLGCVACGPLPGDPCTFLDAEPGDGDRVGVVDDGTASAAAYAAGGILSEVIEEAASTNGRLTAIGVGGAGEPTDYILQDAALNEADLDPEADRFDRIARSAPGCVAGRLESAAPTTAGSDVLGALSTIADQFTDAGPATIIVVTDGAANAGGLDLREVAPATTPVLEIVDSLQAGGLLPRFSPDQRVVFTGLGQLADQTLAQPVRDWLRDLYAAVCERSGAGDCVVAREDAPVGEATDRGGLPDDPAVPFPVVSGVSVDGGCAFTIGAALLFDADSADLRPGVEVELQPVVRALTNQGATALVVGHTSSWGIDDESRRQTSLERARAVASALGDLGVDASRLAVEGVGAADPVAVDRDPDGTLLEGPASQNRRVEIIVSGVPGCAA